MSHTIIIVIITVLISLWAWQDKRVLNRLIFHPPTVRDGQYDRMITHGFIHADGMHLLFNMFTLFSFGRATEGFYNQYMGGYGFVIFYLFAIIAAMIPTYTKNKNMMHYRSLGASGGVSAVLFAFILMKPWSMLFVFFIPMPAIIFATIYICYSVYAGKKGGSSINHSAHLWGAAFGVVATIAIEPNIVPHFFRALMSPSF